MQNGVNLVTLETYQAQEWREKIERSAEAFRVRQTRQIFPSKENFANNTRERSRGQMAMCGKKRKGKK